ncbi:hypothetical protein ACFE04_012712 [Oxalis oulophora]
MESFHDPDVDGVDYDRSDDKFSNFNEHAEGAIIEATGTGTVPAIAVSVGGTLKIPTEQREDIPNAKKRKASDSRINNNNSSVSQSSGLAPVIVTAPAQKQHPAVALAAAQVPVWAAVGNTGIVVPANAFWMIPQPANIPSQQLWAFPQPVFNMAARPMSSLLAAVSNHNEPQSVNVAVTGQLQPQQKAASALGLGFSFGGLSNSAVVGPKVASTKKSTMASSLSSSGGNNNGSAVKTQMLKDFTLEIYDKKELQFRLR